MTNLRSVVRASLLLAFGFVLPACYDNRNNNSYNGPLAFYVDPVFGSNAFGNGSPGYPLQTIGFALQFAIPGDSIILATGTYSASSGEVFPILLKPGVAVVGDPSTKGSTTAIVGAGNYTIQGGTHMGTVITAGVVLGSGTSLSGVKITASGATGVGVVFDGNSGSLGSSTLTGCGASGLEIFQSASPSISSCLITLSGGAGVVTFDNSAPILRQNTITSNTTDGILAQDTSVPNLGDVATPGGNTIQTNTVEGLANNTTASSIPAAGNTWNASVQGADSSGNYATGAANPALTGTNYSITNGAASIQF
ncbi:MAG TPA: DUF1565 domain-containing protein [Planctomycetota bacterium]|nr:DUF1565 domain-containing protein [Planctomycetota bacterium]